MARSNLSPAKGVAKAIGQAILWDFNQPPTFL